MFSSKTSGSEAEGLQPSDGSSIRRNWRKPHALLLSAIALGLVVVVAIAVLPTSTPACGCEPAPPKTPSDEDDLPGTAALLTGDWEDSCEVFTVEPVVDYFGATLDIAADNPRSEVKQDHHQDSDSIVRRGCVAEGHLGSYHNRNGVEEEAFFQVEVSFVPESSVSDAERIFEDSYERAEEEFGGSNDFQWADIDGDWDAGLLRGTWSDHPNRDLPTAVFSWWVLHDEFVLEGELMFDSTQRAGLAEELELRDGADDTQTIDIEHYEEALSTVVTLDDVEEFVTSDYLPQVHSNVLEALGR